MDRWILNLDVILLFAVFPEKGNEFTRNDSNVESPAV